MSDDKRKATNPGVGLPRPAKLPTVIEMGPETRGSTLPAAEGPERRDSIGALDDNDRALLQRVLNTAKTAIDDSKRDRERLEAAIAAEAKERTALEGKVVSRFSDYDARLEGLAGDVAEMKGLAGDIRGLRGDISGLNADVRANLNMDAVRDQKTAALELKVAAIAADEGRDAGKAAGGRSGKAWGALTGTAGPLVFAFIMWLVTALINASQGKPPPAFPSLAPVPTAAPTSSAH
jgi:hypothetical protein